ncbi:MAG TPA: hypothetical protein VFB32_02685 [Rudaea sp.]|nr:hypothetical protein [Rudaea sp.]
MHDSILTYGRSRYLWISVALLVASVVAYAWHDPGGPPNGGTWLGYTLGTIGALLIVWLMFFGIRKRSYLGNIGTLRGWLSAHVFLGTSLILIVLLHSGFQVGWNIHTLAFVLMLVVIFSGFFGVFAYLRYPTLMTRNRENATREAMLEEVAEIDQNALALADGIDPKIHAVVLRSIENTRLGGGVWTQLRARDGSDLALDSLHKAIALHEQKQEMRTAEMPTMFAMVDFLAERATDKQGEGMRKLIDLISRKKSLATKVARDMQYQAMMEIWLYIHVPLSFALLAALTAHIVSSFFYW